MSRHLYYAPMCDIVDAFRFTRSWEFVRREGVNNWSLVGLNERGHVIYEIAHLGFTDVKKVCKVAKKDAEIVEFVGSEVTIPKTPLISLMKVALHWLEEGTRKPGMPTQEETVRMMRTVIAEIERIDPEDQ